MTHNWVLKNRVESEYVNRLVNDLGVSENIAIMLVMRGIVSFEEAKNFFRPSLEDLLDPFLLKDMDKASTRLVQAMRNKEKIVNCYLELLSMNMNGSFPNLNTSLLPIYPNCRIFAM